MVRWERNALKVYKALQLAGVVAMVAAMVFSIAGCAAFGPNPNVSAEQAKVYAGDNKGFASCSNANTMGGSVKQVIIVTDETKNIDTTTTIKGASCDDVTVTTVTRAPPPKAVPAHVPDPAPVSP